MTKIGRNVCRITIHEFVHTVWESMRPASCSCRMRVDEPRAGARARARAPRGSARWLSRYGCRLALSLLCACRVSHQNITVRYTRHAAVQLLYLSVQSLCPTLYVRAGSHRRQALMDDTQRAAFARDGYLVIPNAVHPAQLAALNAEYDAHLRGGKLLRYDESTEDERWNTTDRHGNVYRGRRMWSKQYRDLIDNPAVLPVLRELLADPKWGHAHPALPDQLRSRIRLDHDNIHFQAPVAQGAKPSRGNHLHGGPDAWHITAVYELESVGKGDGGFGALPVSRLNIFLSQMSPANTDSRSNLLCWLVRELTCRTGSRKSRTWGLKIGGLNGQIAHGRLSTQAGAQKCPRTVLRGRRATASCAWPGTYHALIGTLLIQWCVPIIFSS